MKRKIATAAFAAALALFTLFIVLDTFVITRPYQTVADPDDTVLVVDEPGGDPITGTVIGTAQKSGVSVTLTEYTVDETVVYVAEITLDSVKSLKTAFALNTYGRNITETTSQIAADHDALLAINGDYYGAQEYGYVLRNGHLYRSEPGRDDVLAIFDDGTMTVEDPAKVTAEELAERGAWQVFSFGPGLVVDGEITVSGRSEVKTAMNSNPRTAIGMIEPLRYLFVVSDGRTDSSDGLSLYELAEFMKALGAPVAYNLDGGGSSTMVFKGELVNHPTTTGNKIKERGVSDIVYVK